MNPVFDATTQGYLRTRYRAQDILIFDPCTPVFRAQVSAVPTGSTYLSITFDTVSLGAYTDVKIGQTVIVSATSDHTLNPLWEGRVAASATSTVLPINEAAYPLELDYYVTVLDTYKPLPRVRAGSLVDGRLAFQGQTGAIKNLPSAQVVISSTTGSFALSPAIDRFDGSTVSSIAWDIPGASYTVGSSSTLTATVTMPADSHTWGRLTYVLSTGVSAFMVFQLIVMPLSGSALPTQAAEGIKINRGWAGHHAVVKVYKNITVSEVMNGTRCVVASLASFTGGDVALDRVRFVGYFTRESNGVTVTPQGDIERYVQFDIASIWERAAQLPMNPIAIRDAAMPARWDQIPLPTIQNVVNHVLGRYSNIPELCATNVDDTSDTWFGGDMDVNSSSLGDAIKGVLEEINAELTAKPSGELYLRRDLRFEDDTVRNAAPIIWTIVQSDMSSVQYEVRHDEQTGRIMIGFRGYFTNRTPSKGGKALAPAVTLGTSPTTQTRPNQLMPADLSDTALVQAAALRAGQILAAENPPSIFSGKARPQLAYLNPNCFEWVEVDLPSSTLTRDRDITGRYLLVSVEVDYDPIAGSHDVNIELAPETRGGAALVVADLTPNVTQLTGVITPPQFAYGGNYGGPSTLNVPNEETERPFNRGDMGGLGNPIPADQSYQEGLNSPDPGCRMIPVGFYVDTPVETGIISVLGATYTITATGSAVIDAAPDGGTSYNFTTSDYGWTILAANYGTRDGSGWQKGTVGGGVGDRIGIELDLSTETIRSVTVTLNEAYTGRMRLSPYPYSTGITTQEKSVTAATTVTFNTPTGMTNGVAINLFTALYGSVLSPTLRLIEISYTSDLGTEIYGDAQWTWEKGTDELEGQEINIAYIGTDRGLLINGAAIAVPPDYSPSHALTFEWEGDGNEIELLYADDDHSDNSRTILYVRVCGPGCAT